MHGVAEVAQAEQRRDQPRVVALVQADARLVEDVEHAHQPGADLRRQADALRLAAGERRGRAVEGEVVEADVEQEAAAASRISFRTCCAISLLALVEPAAILLERDWTSRRTRST